MKEQKLKFGKRLIDNALCKQKLYANCGFSVDNKVRNKQQRRWVTRGKKPAIFYWP